MKITTTLVTIIVSCLLSQDMMAEKAVITDSKTWTKSFTVNTDAQLNLRCRESDVKITTWDQNRVEVSVTLSVEAFDQEELDKMLEAFAPNISGNLSGVNIQNPDCTSEQVTNRHTKIKINNQIIKVKSYRYNFNIKMPRLNHLSAKTRFSIVDLGNHKGNVNLELYECTINASEINTPSGNMDLKFSQGILGSARELKLNTYESDLSLDVVRILTMDAKFSDLEFEQVRDARVTAYESDLDLGITHTVELKHNFGSFEITEAQQVTLTAYEMTFDADFVSNLIIPNGRFSKIKVGKNNKLEVPAAYESELLIGETGEISMNARFCKLDVGQLRSSLELESYETQVKVDEVSNGFSLLQLDARFTDAEFILANDQQYKLQADISFGSIEIPEADIEGILIDRERSNFRAAGATGNYTGETIVRVRGYETTVKLRKG
jgi:hypothetical protein